MTDFKLDPPIFAGEDGNSPVVGDRYIHRARVCTIVAVKPLHITFEVKTPLDSMTRTVTRAEFAKLEKATLAIDPAPMPPESDSSHVKKQSPKRPQ